MFTLTISCLTNSNLPWFMDLTFQVPMQYCSLQYQTLLSSLHFGPATSFFLELLVVVLCSIPLKTFWTGGLIFWCHIFLPFYILTGFSWLRYCSGLSFPSPVDHVLSELSTMTHLSWVALHGMPHSFIELCKPFCQWQGTDPWRQHLLLETCNCEFFLCPFKMDKKILKLNNLLTAL